MSSANWTPATDGSSATWDINKALSDLERNATIYDDSTTDYDSTTVFYDGYDPTGTTPEGENGALWAKVSE